MTDMATTQVLTGSIEVALLTFAGVELAREYYKIPVNMHGPWTDSVVLDVQSAIERTYFTFLPALAGANVLAGAGHLAFSMYISLPHLVIDDEIHGIVTRALEGFEVNDDTLAADVIRRSLLQGDLMMDPHTLKHLRQVNLFVPQLITRETRTAWETSGSKDMAERAKERTLALFKSHEPTPLDRNISKALAEVIQDASRQLGV